MAIFIASMQNIKYFEKKTNRWGFDKGNPLLSKKSFISFSNSFIPKLKLSLYSLKPIL